MQAQAVSKFTVTAMLQLGAANNEHAFQTLAKSERLRACARGRTAGCASAKLDGEFAGRAG